MTGYLPGDTDERPWGSWECLATGPGYTVKRLRLGAGRRISLQRHHHRSEVWTVAEGRVLATVEDSRVVLEAGATIAVPAGAWHRLEALEGSATVVEVQLGTLLDELDIERQEDDYGRN